MEVISKNLKIFIKIPTKPLHSWNQYLWYKPSSVDHMSVSDCNNMIINILIYLVVSLLLGWILAYCSSIMILPYSELGTFSSYPTSSRTLHSFWLETESSFSSTRLVVHAWCSGLIYSVSWWSDFLIVLIIFDFSYLYHNKERIHRRPYCQPLYYNLNLEMNHHSW